MALTFSILNWLMTLTHNTPHIIGVGASTISHNIDGKTGTKVWGHVKGYKILCNASIHDESLL